MRAEPVAALAEQVRRLIASPDRASSDRDLLARFISGRDEAAFAALSPSRQKAHALSVSDAKTDATRERRVAKVLDSLA